jgi:hypothetical protein
MTNRWSKSNRETLHQNTIKTRAFQSTWKTIYCAETVAIALSVCDIGKGDGRCLASAARAAVGRRRSPPDGTCQLLSRTG